MIATLDTTRGGGSVEASTGSVVPEATVFGESSIDGGIATGWGNHQPQAGSTADAGAEVAGGVSQAADDAPGTDSRALPLVAAGGSGTSWPTGDLPYRNQGSRFTSASFTGLLKAHRVRISMDGRGCWLDNGFVERRWRSLKYEEVYLKGYESVSEAKRGIGDWMHYYNESGPHQSLAYKTPREVYDEGLERVSRAA